MVPNAVARAITFNPAICEVGRSRDHESPGVAPRYLCAAFVDAIKAAVDIATDFGSPVEPDVSTTNAISESTYLI